MGWIYDLFIPSAFSIHIQNVSRSEKICKIDKRVYFWQWVKRNPYEPIPLGSEGRLIDIFLADYKTPSTDRERLKATASLFMQMQLKQKGISFLLIEKMVEEALGNAFLMMIESLEDQPTRQKFTYTVIDYAFRCKKLKFIESVVQLNKAFFFSDKPEDNEQEKLFSLLLFKAAEYGEKEIFHLFTEAGIKNQPALHSLMQTKNGNGETILHLAAYCGQAHFIEDLRKFYGESSFIQLMNAKNKNNATFLHLFRSDFQIHSNSSTMTRNIRDAYAYSDEACDAFFMLQDNRGETFLHSIVRMGGAGSLIISQMRWHFKFCITKLFRQKNHLGETVLHLAVSLERHFNWPTMLELLEQAYAKDRAGLISLLKEKNLQGDNFLHLTALHNDLAMFEDFKTTFAKDSALLTYLLQKKNSNGETFPDMVMRLGRMELASLMVLDPIIAPFLIDSYPEIIESFLQKNKFADISVKVRLTLLPFFQPQEIRQTMKELPSDKLKELLSRVVDRGMAVGERLIEWKNGPSTLEEERRLFSKIPSAILAAEATIPQMHLILMEAMEKLSPLQKAVVLPQLSEGQFCNFIKKLPQHKHPAYLRRATLKQKESYLENCVPTIYYPTVKMYLSTLDAFEKQLKPKLRPTSSLGLVETTPQDLALETEIKERLSRVKKEYNQFYTQRYAIIYDEAVPSLRKELELLKPFTTLSRQVEISDEVLQLLEVKISRRIREIEAQIQLLNNEIETIKQFGEKWNLLKETPPEFLCTIKRVVMEDPVRAADNQIYDRRFIEEWFTRLEAAGQAIISPYLGHSMSKELEPLPELKAQIENWEQESL